MSEYKRTIVIGMDYSQFSGGITEINRKMGLLDAEFRRATEESKLYGTETDQLSVKQEMLRQKIELQQKKVTESAKAYDHAVAAHGNLSAATDKANKAFINENTTLLRLQNELQSTEKRLETTEKQMEETGKETETFGDSIRGVADYLGLSASPAIENFASKFDGTRKEVGEAILVLGTLATTLGTLTLKTAESTKEIINKSQVMGMTTDQYQEWDYVLRMVGSDIAGASGDLASLAQKAVEATDKTSETSKTFRLLGVNVKDTSGNLKSQNQLLTEVIAGLQKMTDETTRNALANELLGGTGQSLVPVLNMTSKELSGLKKEAHDTGYVMSGKTLDGFHDLNKAMIEFEGVTKGLSNSFATALLPMLTAFFEAISSIPTPVLQMIITLTTVVTSLVMVVKAIDSTVGAFGKISHTFSSFNPQAMKTTAIILGVVAALVALAAIIAVITGKGNDLNRTMASVSDSVSSIQGSMMGKAQYHAKGTDDYPGGETWVGENGPERVILPRGSRIVNAEDSKKESGNIYYCYVTIDAKNVKEFNDVVNLFQREQISFRAGRVRP